MKAAEEAVEDDEEEVGEAGWSREKEGYPWVKEWAKDCVVRVEGVEAMGEAGVAGKWEEG